MFSSNQDIYKFALFLHDELAAAGKTKPAQLLEDTIECCWSTSEEALHKHRHAFKTILDNYKDELSDSMIIKLESAIKKIGGMIE